jgi:hypothetical protein
VTRGGALARRGKPSSRRTPTAIAWSPFRDPQGRRPTLDGSFGLQDRPPSGSRGRPPARKSNACASAPTPSCGERDLLPDTPLDVRGPPCPSRGWMGSPSAGGLDGRLRSHPSPGVPRPRKRPFSSRPPTLLCHEKKRSAPRGCLVHVHPMPGVSWLRAPFSCPEWFQSLLRDSGSGRSSWRRRGIHGSFLSNRFGREGALIHRAQRCGGNGGESLVCRARLWVEPPLPAD